MKINKTICQTVKAFFTLVVILSFFEKTSAQQQLTPKHFVLYSNGTGTTLIGSSITINGGRVGSKNLVQTTGNVTINSKIHSGNKIILSNSNIINGNITAANSSNSTDIIFSTGSSATIVGNIDVKGRVSIGGGSVTGIVTIPPPITNYSGPTPTAINISTPPVTPLLPTLIKTPIGGPIVNDTITGNFSQGPGYYGNIVFTGNKTMKLNGPGVYVFNSIKMTGNSNKLEFNFNDNQTDNYIIYIRKNADFGKLSAYLTANKGGSADRISFEIQGNGIGTSIPNYSFIIANGSSGGGSKWLGSVLTTDAGINIGSGTGSSTLTGTFASQTNISLQSGVTVNYSPFNFCEPPTVKATVVADSLNFEVDTIPLDFTGHSRLTVDSTPGVRYLWLATNGGIISSSDTIPTITVSASGTYIVHAFTRDTFCSSKDTVVVTAKVKNIIGAELLSIYLNYDTGDPNPDLDSFFVTSNDSVLIDIFCDADEDTSIVRKRLTDQDFGADPVEYGLTKVLPNGLSPHTITGTFPVKNLLKLNDLDDILNFCRTYYRPTTNFKPVIDTGLVVSQGDTTARTFLVRKGFNLDGTGIKIGVISDSYKTIDDPVNTYKDSCNNINQTLIVNNEEGGASQGDLLNVTVVLDFPIKLSDEGRAMMEIINDIAPGAQKYFRTGFFTAGDMADAIDSLVKLGCKIIVDDVSYVTEPMFKDGIIAKTVNRVKQEDSVLYFTSAGNFGKKSYEKNFNPVKITNIPGFNGKYAHNFRISSSDSDVFQKVWLKPGNNMLVFQWLDDVFSIDDPAGATKFDMDIYLSKNTDGTGLIAFNRDNTDGDPIEFIPIRIPKLNPCDTAAQAYNIFIVNNTPGGDPTRIKYIAYQGDFRMDEYNEGNSTIVGQANAEGAIAVGASRFNHFPKHPLLPTAPINMTGITKPQIEYFSSIGGTLVNGTTTARLKPDLVGPDGVNTTVLMGQDYPSQALDTFSNFFGTSAAAPHAAATAALLMEGRQKYLGKTQHPVDSLKLLMQSTAVDMRPASMGTNDYNFFTKIGTYDYVSGAGMIDADSAMRTFASPKPFEIKLVLPTNIIPCQDPFILTIVGENFADTSKVYVVNAPGDTTRLTPFYISRTHDTMRVTINSCVGNPEIFVYTKSKPRPAGVLYDDGGLSNGIKLFNKEILVKTLNTEKFYGEANPVFSTVVLLNGDTITNLTTPNLDSLGLSPAKLNLIATTAGQYSNVNFYSIKVYRTFSNTNAKDLALTNQYSYVFTPGILTIKKLPLKVRPNDKTGNQSIVYSHAVGKITYTYKYSNGTEITDPVLKAKFDSSYQVYKPDNVLAVINNYPGSTGLTDAQLTNISGMATFNAVKNSRKYQVLSGGVLNPLPSNSTLFNVEYFVDVSAQSLANFKANPASVQLLPSYPGIHSRAIVGAKQLAAGEIDLAPGVNPLNQMINGLLVKSVNTTNFGSLVPIYSNNLLQMTNGVQVTISGNDTVPIPNESLVQVSNGVLVKTVNGELQPLANNVLVKMLDNTIMYQTSNALLVKTVNGTSEPVLNGLLVKTVNGVLVKTVNNEPVANNTVIQMSNGLLVKSVNNFLLQLTSGVQLPVADGLQVVNGLLVKSVNGTDVPISNSIIDQVGGNFVQRVNSFTSTTGDNQDAAVIIDSDDINVEHGYLGAMFSTDMITGLTLGYHKIIPGILINRNVTVTYETGDARVIEDNGCIQTHSPFKNFGNTSPDPTSLWLNLTTKVSGQLANHGDYLLFKNASVTFNNIGSDPLIVDKHIPDGKIVADSTICSTCTPLTHYDGSTWITRVPVNFSSTSDIFVTGDAISSSNGFIKLNGNTSTVVKGAFYSNRTFSDQWTYGIAAYQPQFNNTTIGGEGQVVSINGNLYRAGTPLVNDVPLQFLVQGASGGGGQNYTGSSASFQAFTACIDLNPLPPGARIINSSLTMETDQKPIPTNGLEILINPNPATGHITVSFVPVRTGISKIEIFTINGRKVIEADWGICEAENRYIKQIDVNKLVNGIYLVRVWNAGSITNKKIVIAR